MFERFTTQARTVVTAASQQASQLGHARLGTEHLLLAMLDPEAGIAATVLAVAGVEVTAVRADVVRLAGTPTDSLDEQDAAALSSIGIDLPTVLARIEQAAGVDAVPPTAADDRDSRWYRRVGGRARLTPRAKKTIELSLREAIAHHDDHIGSEHLLLGLLRAGDGRAATILTARGVALDQLRRSTLAALDRAA